MKFKQMICSVSACALLIGCLGIPSNVQAASSKEALTEYVVELNVTRATGSFSMKVPANSKVRANSSFPLSAGETVRINASYTPDGSVDFGLVTPDGKYRYFTVTNGSIDNTIEADQNGNYTFQIRNNSSKEISVSGYVNY